MNLFQRIVLGLLPWVTVIGLVYAYPWIGIALVCAAILCFFGIGLLLGGQGQGRCQTPEAHQMPLTPDIERKIVTYFYPGLGGSWMRALHYAGPEGFPDKGAQIIASDLTGTKPDRVLASFTPHIPTAPLLMYSLYLTNPPEVIEVYDMRDMFARPMSFLWWYTGLVTTLGVSLHKVCYPVDYIIDPTLVSFAQHDDIQHFLTVIRESRNDPVMDKRTVILAGSSRGASTVLGAVVNMTPEEQAGIGLVLLEGAFDTVPNVAKFRFGKVLGRLVPWLLSWTTRYDPAFPTPLELARQFPKNVPVAFITSMADTVVPMSSTLALRDTVLAARNGNAEHLHTLVLGRSGHSVYATGNLEDQTRYRGFVNELYQKYVK